MPKNIWLDRLNAAFVKNFGYGMSMFFSNEELDKLYLDSKADVDIVINEVMKATFTIVPA
jgi:ribosomal protein L20